MAGKPVVLLHGMAGTASMWDQVVQALPPAVEAHAIELRGHGEPLPAGAEPTIAVLADGVEAALDARGLDRAAIVGNSMGAWLALELAARGRATAVLALAPAGFWDPDDERGHRSLRRLFHRQAADARRSRPILPLVLALPPVRRYALRKMAVRGERVSRSELLAMTDGVLACTALAMIDLERRGAGRYELDVPIRVLLSEHDRVFPPDEYEPRIRERLPGAVVERLPAAGHVPMLDAPDRVAAEVVRVSEL